jgi:hypothetical protein
MRRLQLLLLCGLIACTGSVCRGADTQPPWVSITSPLSGTNVSSTVLISVTATDDVGVASVRLKVDGADIRAPLTNAPFLHSLNTWKLANGMHSLMAVATDAAGDFARSPVVSISVTNPPPYTLAPGPFTVENLGSLLSGATLWQQWMFRLPSNNDLHLLTYYSVASFAKPTQILDANLTKGTARLTNISAGRPLNYSTVLYSNNNKCYTATGSPGYFVEYDPLTGGTNIISIGADRYPQDMEVGYDGWIYLGQYSGSHGGCLSRYNPTNATFQDWGTVDPAAMGSAQYGYTVGADGRYVFVGLGTSPFYLAIYDTQGSTTNFYWKTNNDTGGWVLQRKTQDGWDYERKVSDGSIIWYSLSNGVPTVIATPAPYSHYDNYSEKPGIVLGTANFPSHYSTEVNTDYAYPFGGSNYATIRWRTVGDTNWQSVSATNLSIEPISVQRLYLYTNNTLLGLASGYLPAFLYDLNTSNTTILGTTSFSLYDAVLDSERVYFSGYSAALLDYEKSQPWTLTASTPTKTALGVNPRQTGLMTGHHYYYSCFGSDGQVYVAIQHERVDNGGELGWYDPVTKTTGSIRNTFTNDFNPMDLKPALGATKIIYSETSGRLYVMDVATKTIERTNNPLGGVPMDKIVEVVPGLVFGATSNLIFLASITNNTVFYTNTLPDTAFMHAGAFLASGERLVLGPDGYVWMFVGNSLYRINPLVGSMVKILDRTASSLLFVGGDLYLYGGPSYAASSRNLYRVRGVLHSLLSNPPTNLRVMGTGKK